MKTGNEIGMHIIKCENKQGTDSIKDLHYKINDILFPLSKMYISSKRGDRVLKQLIALGTELKELEVNNTAILKKNEILQQLRDICRKLKQYIDTPEAEDDNINQTQAVINYAVSQYLRNKDKYMNDDVALLKCLKNNKEIAEDYLPPYDVKVKIKSFQQMQHEILEYLYGKYKI